MRTDYDKLFPNTSCLRKLASKIASLDWAAAKTHDLLTAKPAPYNLLSNGETGSGWRPPTGFSPDDLVLWKQTANGFGGPTQRGLALMFDPFVDACLLINAAKNQGFQQRTKVLVLTDYHPLKSVIGEMALMQGQDWAESVINGFLQAEELGLTGNNIFKALLEKDFIEDVKKLGSEAIWGGFEKHKLLIWNYFPFLRGGLECENEKGLPVKSCKWIQYCEELLIEFLRCVHAERVIFATNQRVRELRAECVGENDTIASNYDYIEVDHPGSWRSPEKMKECSEKFRTFLNK